MTLRKSRHQASVDAKGVWPDGDVETHVSVIYLSWSPRLRTILSRQFMADILYVDVRCSCVVDPYSVLCIFG